MKIQQLLETDLYRYQYEWENKEEPIIQVPARIGRRSNTYAIVPYSMHYALGQIGLNAPKRWNSSFATSAPGESLFLGDGQHDGIRRIEIPGDRPVGFIVNDFNDHTYGEFQVPYFALQFSATHEGTELADELTSFMETYHTDDEGYAKFVAMVPKLDAFLKQKGASTFTDFIVKRVKPFVDANQLGVTRFDNLQEGNFEVWFEGPYEAHLDDQFRNEDEDGPDPHDRDR